MMKYIFKYNSIRKFRLLFKEGNSNPNRESNPEPLDFCARLLVMPRP